MIKKIFILSFLILFYPKTFAQVSNGTETNGGDAVAAEFLSLFDTIIADMNLSPIELSMFKALEQKRTIVRVTTAPSLRLDGSEVDAINQPNISPPTITISQRSWERLTPVQKRHLTVHEMLPISGFADKDYTNSSLLMSRSPMIYDSKKQLIQSLWFCRPGEIMKLRKSDFELVRDLNPASAAATTACVPAFQIMASIGWDFNQCDDGYTALGLLDLFKKDLPMNNYSESRQILIDHEAQPTCK